MTEHTKYSVPAVTFIDSFKHCGIDFITTVPDMLQIALHRSLEDPAHGIRTVNCTTEDQAIETAAGLYAGGRNPAVLVQNQGFYAGINSVRALGLDSGVPLFFVIGQFGREFSNLGDDPRQSRRRMVRLLEPLLDTLEIPYWRLEGPQDSENIETAWRASRSRQGPAALLVGHFVGW